MKPRILAARLDQTNLGFVLRQRRPLRPQIERALAGDFSLGVLKLQAPKRNLARPHTRRVRISRWHSPFWPKDIVKA